MSQAAHRDEFVEHHRHAGTGALHLPDVLKHARTEIEAAHVIDREDAHGHAPAGERGIDLGGRRAFFDEQLRLAHIRKHHAIADESVRVAHQHADLA